MNINACLSHQSDNWKTPTWLYNKFMELNYIDCFKYQSQENELDNYYKNKKLFINPPFSKMNEITDWIIEQIGLNNTIALLIPARTDTTYFHKLIRYNPIIIFIKGRLKYNDSKSAPFPTILMIFRPNMIFGYMTIYLGMTQEELIEWLTK